jgi:hypothetical protein
MEGIVDGAATDSCFVCGLLYPEELAEACPRCGRRMRYEPAALMDPEALAARVREEVEALRRAGDAPVAARRAALEALLSTLHRFSPEALEVCRRAGGPGIEALRAAWEAAGGERPA